LTQGEKEAMQMDKSRKDKIMKNIEKELKKELSDIEKKEKELEELYKSNKVSRN